MFDFSSGKVNNKIVILRPLLLINFMKVFRIFFAFAVTALLLINLHAQEKEKVLDISSQDIVILYDNDVHGSLEGYPLMAGLRDEVLQKTPNVALVSSGDFLSGNAYTALSDGEYPVRMMNAVGYDFVTLGNHEFDFGVANFQTLISKVNAHIVCCNFQSLPDQKNLFDAYAIKDFGGVKVAFIGIATPATYSSTAANTFADAAGKDIYSFHTEELSQWVQQQVDAARREGADYVVVLSHLGIEGPALTSIELIAQTNGIDAVLDGHSHSVIPSELRINKDGQSVILTSTGTAFKNIGALVIDGDGKLSTVLVPTKGLTNTNAQAEMEKAAIDAKFEVVAGRVVGTADVKLTIMGADGKRAVRNQETNEGDFVADAFRVTTQSQIGWVNGGGCRKDVSAGTFTVGHIYDISSFTSRVVVASVSGQELLDALEMGVRVAPKESGGFPQVSGLAYDVDTTILSTVVIDDKDVFVTVTGERRVHNVRVYNFKKGKYQPLSPKKWYRVASLDFILLQNGDGMRFSNLRDIHDTGEMEQVAMERYIKEYLGGRVGQEYAQPQGRVRFVKK